MPELRRPRPLSKLQALPQYGNPKGSMDEREAWMRRKQQLKAAGESMVKISKPITRETAIFERTSPIVVTLHPKAIELRLKGERSSHMVPYDVVLDRARKRAMPNGRK